MEWLGVVGSLVGAVIIRFGSPSTFLAAAVVAFVANMAFVALVVGFIVHLVERQTKRGPAHA